MRRKFVASIMVTAVALGCATRGVAVGGGKEKIRLTARDQRAARGAVSRRSDLTPASDWSGGAVKPDFSAAPTCPTYHPKRSDLVLTGAAETRWKRAGLDLDSTAHVFRSARMMQLNWQRTVQAPGAVQCLRSHLLKAIGSTAKLVSFDRVAMPPIAPYAATFRLVLDVTTQGLTLPVTVDVIVAARGRTEVGLTSIAVGDGQSTASDDALRLARILVARTRA